MKAGKGHITIDQQMKALEQCANDALVWALVGTLRQHPLYSRCRLPRRWRLGQYFINTQLDAIASSVVKVTQTGTKRGNLKATYYELKGRRNK